MHRIFFLIAGFVLANSEAPESPGLVWLENPPCGGILIEPNIVLSLKKCYGPKTQAVWPYKSEISYVDTCEDSELVILVLERFLPDPVELIRTSELKYLKEMMPIHFSNLKQSVQNWIHALKYREFTAFYGVTPPLIGSPVWTELTPGEHRAVGMITGEKTAIRLDPHFNFIATVIKAAREQKLPQEAPPEQSLAILPAVTIAPERLLIAIPAQVVEPKLEPESKLELIPEPKPEPKSAALIKPPESLGCSCSQVRRWRR